MESVPGHVVDALPGLVWTALPDGQIDFCNRRWCEYTGLGADGSCGRGWQTAIHPADLPRLLAGWREVPASSAPVEMELRLRGADEKYRWFLFRAHPVTDASGQVVKWCGLGTDIDERKQAEDILRASERRFRLIVDDLPVKRVEALLAGEKQLLEMVAGGRPMSSVLESLCRLVESTASGCYCSIVLVDPTGTKLQEAIAPSLAAEFNESVRGWPLHRIGGPCVVAARDKTQVIMSDVASDTRWRNGWRALAQAHGLSSCWSTPIISLAGKVLGTFALYQREPGSPNPLQLELIGQFTHLASITIESAQRDAALRQSEARLAAAERDLQLMIDTIPVFVAAYQPDGTRSFVNRTWQDYMGLTLAEATGTGAKTFPHFHPADAEMNDKAWRDSLASGEPLSIEARVRRADGQYRWHISRRVPLRDEQGNIVRWYSVGIDIDDQKVAEDALRRSEAQLADAKRELQATIDTIPALVASYWPNGERDFVNLAWQRFTGRSQEEARGKTQMIPAHPDRRALGESMWRRCLETGEPFELEEQLQRVDGAYRWHWVRRVPARDENGKVTKWYGVGHDIDDQKQVESALRQSEAELAETERELRLMLDSIPTITWRAGPNGYVQHLNKRWFDYTGTTPEQVRGKRWQSCVHPDDLERLVDIGRAYVASGQPIDGEARLRRFDGEYRWFLFRPAPARDETGKIVAWYGSITDIEDRKCAEEKANEAERELQMAIDNIPVLVGTFAADGSRLFVNKRTFEVTGLSAADVPADRWTRKAFHPEDVEAVESLWRTCLATGEPFEREIRTRAADGTYRWHLTRRVPVRDAAGKVTRWYGIGHDIEDRKRAEEALQKSEAELIEAKRALQQTIDTIPSTVARYSAEGKREFVNAAWKRYTGLSDEAALGTPWSILTHPDDVADGENKWREARANGQPLHIEARFLRADGQYRWLAVDRVPLHDEDGNVSKWYSVSYDIEDRKRAEEAVKTSERNLKLTIDTIPALAWSVRLDGSAEFFSQHYLDYMGLSLQQAQDWGWSVAVHPDDRTALAAVWRTIRASGKAGEAEARLRRHDGEYRWFLFRASPLRDESGDVVKWYGVNTDIEDRKRAEERIRNTQADLAHMTRVMTMGALTASIAHEVNQPLAGIITNAGTCLRMLAADPPNVEGARETARRTIRDGNRAADVIARLRALFGKKAFATETLDLNEATREVLALVFSDLLRNRVTLQTELDDDPLLVSGDRVQLQQVILNLVRNASDAMSSVNDRPRHLLVRADSAEEGRVRLTVKDVGVGFESQGAEKFFDAFYTTKNEGMGIGLFLSRSIIESHGGKLWAEPNDGPGATFSFSIPRQAANDGDEGTPGAISTRPTRGAHDLTRNA